MSPRKKPQALRCAVYTRKSTEEGLEQAFNTLDSQLEAGETSLRSQRHQGCCLVPKHFDDGRLADDLSDTARTQRDSSLATSGAIGVSSL